MSRRYAISLLRISIAHHSASLYSSRKSFAMMQSKMAFDSSIAVSALDPFVRRFCPYFVESAVAMATRLSTVRRSSLLVQNAQATTTLLPATFNAEMLNARIARSSPATTSQRTAAVQHSKTPRRMRSSAAKTVSTRNSKPANVAEMQAGSNLQTTRLLRTLLPLSNPAYPLQPSFEATPPSNSRRLSCHSLSNLSLISV